MKHGPGCLGGAGGGGRGARGALQRRLGVGPSDGDAKAFLLFLHMQARRLAISGLSFACELL